MANVIINDTNLTNIANAIREKNGETTSYKPSEMAAAIAAIEGGGGGYVPTDDELKYPYDAFSNGNNIWVWNAYGDRIVFQSSGNMSETSSGAWASNKFEHFDNNVNVSNISIFYMQNLFSNCYSLKDIKGKFIIVPNYTGIIYTYNMYGMFTTCNMLNSIPDDLFDTSIVRLVRSTSTSNNRFYSAFYDCYSLREIPKFYFNLLTDDGAERMTVNSPSYVYNQMFTNCYALNKIEGLPVPEKRNNGGNITDNMFNNTFGYCYNLTKLTFQTNTDGTPLTANWTNQTIDLTQYVGYAYNASHMKSYNSGITGSSVGTINPSTDDLGALKGFFSGDNLYNNYSTGANSAKYGHTEAVETINSLPDTTAVGGGNTIKFKSQGGYTDYLKGKTSQYGQSSISKLTEEEIAVATAKGWTVTIT